MAEFEVAVDRVRVAPLLLGGLTPISLAHDSRGRRKDA
jgi:hypothetical protein